MVSYLLKAALAVNTEDILCYLKTGLTKLSSEEVDLISNYVFVWNIRGLDWLSDWNFNPAGLEDSKTSFDDELNELNRIRRIAVEPIIKLRQNSWSSVSELVASVYKILCRIGVREQLKDYAETLKNNGENLSSSLQYASWDCLMSVLDKLSFSLSDSKTSLKEFFRVFDNCIQTETIGDIPQGIDEVVIGSADRVRTGYVKISFLVGVNQGIFPAVKFSDGLLSVSDREQLISLGTKIPDRYINDLIEEKLRFYNACCTATQQVYICYSLTDLQLHPLEPSRVVDKVLNCFPGCRRYNESFGREITPECIESFHSAFEKAAISWSDENSTVAAIKECFKDSEEFKRLKLVEESQEIKNLSIHPDTAQKLYGKDIKLSASKIDTYFHCKFQYFCRYGLGAKLLRKADMNALVRGTLVHYLLEKVLSNHKTDVQDLTGDIISKEVDRFTDAYFAELKIDKAQLGVVFGYMLKSLKSLVIGLLERISAEFSQSAFKIDECELQIGDLQEIKSLKIDLSDGGSVCVNGVIDRVDVAEYNGRKYIRIIDYKTGVKKIALSDLLLGLNLQMMIYLYTIVKNGAGKYSNSVGCGILYMPAKSVVGDVEANSKLRMNGLLTDNIEVLRLMEKELKNQFIPVEMTKSMKPSQRSSVVSEAVFESVYSHIDKVLSKMGLGLHNGDISIDPVDSSDTSACKYCDFYSVCRKEKLRNKRPQTLSNGQAGEILLSGEGEKW
ncbi:MAG: PD-(D/E)XK nuclease family protein, partial [bacterium]|nr:PD-(D/E)XK nuclease family protein [bacterium]